MDIFNASAMGMMFNKVNLDDLLGGASAKLSQAQEDIAEQLGNAAALAGGLSPGLQQQISESMRTRFPQAVHYMISAGQLAMQHRDKLAKIPQYVHQFGSNGVRISLSAGQIAAGTTSAFITMCHVVASYDNAVKLAEAHIKLDELLKIHSRKYKAELEAVYNRLGDLFLESAHGQDVAAELKNCSQSLDRLVLIWLDEVSNELSPVQESPTGAGVLSKTENSFWFVLPTNLCLPPQLAVLHTVLAGSTVLAGHIIYSSWVKDIKTCLDKVDRLLRWMGIAIWLRDVISHHAASMQPVYNRYSTRLEQISSKAGKIKQALAQSAKFINVEARVMQQLEELKSFLSMCKSC